MYRLFSSDALRKMQQPYRNWLLSTLLLFLFNGFSVAQNCSTPFGLHVDVQHESCVGASDGSLSITTTTPDVEFSLDKTTFQTDTLFENLSAASYTVFARQIADTLCIDSTLAILKADTIVPALDCATVTVQLASNGTATLPIQGLIRSLSDNCTDSADIQLVPNTLLSFTCSDAGMSRPQSIEAIDSSGNSVQCFASINVLPFAPCTPSFSINSPCTCKNNATTLQNGQFIDTIIVEALAGQNWTVTAAAGFFDENSAAPPAAPTTMPLGTALLPLSGNLYQLVGLHVDSLGYALTIKNNQGDSLNISSLCTYPTPIFSLAKDTFCVSSAPIALVGQPGDSNPLEEQFTLDGVVVTTFDPTMITPGAHTLTYRVDGGIPSSVDASDAGCIDSVSRVFDFVTTPTQMICNNAVQLSLPATCSTHVQADQILEGTYFCYDDYLVELFDTAGLFIGNLVDASHVGQTLSAMVTHLPTQNVCMGALIHVEDKIPPSINCADITVSTVMTDLDPYVLFNDFEIEDALPAVQENCGSTNLVFSDFLVLNDACATPYNKIIERTWTVNDESQNMAFCSQLIKSESVAHTAVQFPANALLDCQTADTSIAATGVPTVLFDGQYTLPVFPDHGTASFHVSYSDELVPICGGMEKVLRTWSVTDWCLPIQAPTNPVEYVQVLEILDTNTPSITCPSDLTVSTGFDSCALNYDLPDVGISDNCSEISFAKAQYRLPDTTTYELLATLSPIGAGMSNADTLAVFSESNPLPIGTTHIVYSAVDACTNLGTCSFNVTVEDAVPPIALCNPYSKLSLGLDGKASVSASAFDNGSYDNCASVQFKCRRMEASACQDNQMFYDKAEFCCVDVADTLNLVFRAYDVPLPAGALAEADFKSHSNDCMAQIIIEDNLAPSCTPPAPVVVNCLAFDATLSSYGAVSGTDNCTLNTSYSVDYSNFDTLCNLGEIIRVFTVSDNGNASNTCTQRIQVTGNQEFFIQFPDDEHIFTCNAGAALTEPVFYREDCELLGLSYVDDTLQISANSCKRINRRWRVTNWCAYDSTDVCIDVPNPNPISQVNDIGNRPAPFLSNICDQNDPWAATSVAVYPGTPPFEYCTLYDSAASCYEYTQTIDLFDGSPPTVLEYVLPEPCDLSENDAAFWSANFWWDPLNEVHDLSEAKADLSISVFDACSETDIDFVYELHLDLDGDGAMETIIDSDAAPAARFVNYKNAGQNNSGGTPQQFDFRILPQAEWYRFGLKVVRDSSQTTASVVWKQTADYQVDTAGILPELPLGTHEIHWFATDGCGNTIIEKHPFTISDCKKPSIQCKNSISVNMPNSNPSSVSIFASDVLNTVDDNATPLEGLKIGLCLNHVDAPSADSCSGSFPIFPSFSADTVIDLVCGQYFPNAPVQLWALDRSGNVDFCQTTITMVDNFGNCSPGMARTMAGKLTRASNSGAIQPLRNASVQLNGIGHTFAVQQNTDANGTFTFANVPLNGNYRLVPSKNDDHLNGVNAYDLLLIQKHLLGTEPIRTPYKLIAADINKSGSITPTDIIELRKLILGIHANGLPDNTSWRFVHQGHIFTNINNPFQDSIPETIDVLSLNQSVLALDFESLKVGDIDHTALLNAQQNPSNRNAAVPLLFEEKTLQTAASFCVAMELPASTGTYQFSLQYDDLILEKIEGLDAEQYIIFEEEGILNIAVAEGQNAFLLCFKALSEGFLSEKLTLGQQSLEALSFDAKGQAAPLRLQIKGAKSSHTLPVRISAQPNPCTKYLDIAFSLEGESNLDIELVDALGRVVFSEKNTFPEGAHTHRIQTTQLTSGLYRLDIKTASQKVSQTVLKVE